MKNKIKVHSFDHVNCSQSTNDVNPSALKISSFYLLGSLNDALSFLIESLEVKAKEFKNINKNEKSD